MFKKYVFIALSISLLLMGTLSAFAATTYPLENAGDVVTTRYVEFEEIDGNVVATTVVSDVKAGTKLALIMSEVVGENVKITDIDYKTVTDEETFEVSLKKNEGSIYKAYVWNYTSLTPYTNTAEYPSKNVALEELKIGNLPLDTATKTYDLTISQINGFPIVTGLAADNGTKGTVTVNNSTKKVTITLVSSDGTTTEEFVINYKDITTELKNWLRNAGIDTGVGITMYVIDENDI